MARISTLYDKDIREQVFMIRGDERYARSTKTTISLGEAVLHSENFDLPIHVDVFRDVENSNLVIYDNDLPVKVIEDWVSIDNGRDILIDELNYDVPHEIYAKYIGNGKCSPSSSKKESITIKNPYLFDSEITIILPPISNRAMDGIQIILSDTGHEGYNKFQDLELWYDDTLITTINTGNNGQILTSISDVGDIGLHELKVVYEGSNHLTPCTETVPVNVGYNIEIIDAPLLAVHGGTATFKVKLTDFIGNLVAHQGVIVYSYSGSTRTSFAQAVTGDNGIATLTGTVNSALCTDGFKIASEEAKDTDYINVRIVKLNNLTLNSNSPRLFKGQNNVLTANIGQNIEGVPVTFSELKYESDTLVTISTEVIHTNANGTAVKNIKGDGTENKIWRVECGDQQTSKLFKDYAQYWAIPDEFSTRNYSLNPYGTVYLLTLQSLFQLDCQGIGDYTMYVPTSWQNPVTLITEDNKPYTFTMENVRTQKLENGGYLPISFKEYKTGQSFTLSGDNSKITVIRDENEIVYIKDNAGHSYTLANQGGNPVIISFLKTTTFTKLTVRNCVDEEV